jgi:hypothetical protein
MRCDANSKCGISCDPGQGCGCIYVHPSEPGGTGECICECFGGTSTEEVKVSIGNVVRYMSIRRYKPKFKTNARTKLDICANRFPAAVLAQILDRILPDKILVPAKQVNVRIRLRSRSSTVSKIVKSSGFIMKR